MMHADKVFREAVEACRMLGVGGIFLTKFRAQLPSELPPFVHHCEFALFRDLFPRCAVVVHHGGIGTVASALAAGTPQLIIPFAFDQLDNASRVKRLGAGNWLKRNQARAPAIAAALTKLILPEANARAQSLVTRFDGCSGVERAVERIEAFLSVKRQTVVH
jgi:UDP:flavonoid glycosyltransferase YjiC (YdhE family)